MYNGKRVILTVLVILFLASLLYPVWSQDGQGLDYVDNNTSNIDGVADIGSHSDFPAQQARTCQEELSMKLYQKWKKEVIKS